MSELIHEGWDSEHTHHPDKQLHPSAMATEESHNLNRE